MKLGYAAGKVLTRTTMSSGSPTVLIGKDTRISGYMLEASLQAGLSAAGVDVMLSGPMPTPAVAYLTRALRPVSYTHLFSIVFLWKTVFYANVKE